MSTLYLHIGTSKTGTTAIQHFLRTNKPELVRKGYCYPVFLKRYPRVRDQRNGHFLVDYMMNARKPDKRDEQNRLWRKHMDYVERLLRKYPNVILSDEVIWYHTKFTPSDMWERLKGEAERFGFELKVIVYLRRQDQFLSSVYLQKLKFNSSFTTPFSDYIADPEAFHAVDYFEQLERIAAVIGRENIIVRVYERERLPGGDVNADFLSALGLRIEDGFRILDEVENPTIRGDFHEILRTLNSLPNLGQRGYSLTRQAAINCTLSTREPTSSLYSRQEVDALLARYEESNRSVARVYCHSDAPLFTPPDDAYPPKWTPGEHMYASIVRYFGELSQLQLDWVRNRLRPWTRLGKASHRAYIRFLVLCDYLLLR